MLPGGRPALLLLLLTGLAVPPLSAGGGTVPLQVPLGAPPCPCSAPALCRPITTTREREVFGFAVSRATPYDRWGGVRLQGRTVWLRWTGQGSRLSGLAHKRRPEPSMLAHFMACPLGASAATTGPS